MPGSGANLLWDETAPADTNNAGGGAGAIRSLETSLRNGLAVEHVWPNATGSGFGVHLPGSARAYYGPESTVSSSGTDGRLMVTSDTSHLFHVGSAGTMFLGGSGSLQYGSFMDPLQGGGGQSTYFVFETGNGVSPDVTNASSAFRIDYPNGGFGRTPILLCQVVGSATTPYVLAANRSITVAANSATSATVVSFQNASNFSAPGIPFYWMAIGERSF